MYLLTAIFNKSCLVDVLQDLKEHDIEGITISDVTGKGGYTVSETSEKPYLNENIRVDIVVSNDTYKELVKEIIRSNTRELNKGSGKMWVTPVLEVERIRTGELNESALNHSDNTDKSKHSQSYYTPIDTPAS
jgi:nitrogen regulatory protein PII